MRTIIVTSMNNEGWQRYGRAFLSSFEQHWPKNIQLEVYAEDFEIGAECASNVKILCFRDHVGESFQKFESKQKALFKNLGIEPIQSYRLDAAKFSKKALTIAAALQRHQHSCVIWLDADVVSFREISEKMLEGIHGLLDQNIYCSYLRRFGMHTESGFLAFNTGHPLNPEFANRFLEMYTSGAIFHLEAWTDCHVFDCLKAYYASFGYEYAFREIPSVICDHPFINSPLGLFMDHLKGNRKNDKTSDVTDFRIPPRSRVNFAGRYLQIKRLIELYRPGSIIEVGTWSGWRAAELVLNASRYSDKITYHGYDVFESGNNRLDQREMNVKPHFTLSSVKILLELVKCVVPNFTYSLTQGDTNQTLTKGMTADFVFIDGGHSLQTIENDFNALKNSKIVLLDDYYSGPIDTHRFGCNAIVNKYPHRILPVADPVVGGGTTSFAVVADEEYLNRLDEEFYGITQTRSISGLVV